MCMMMLVVVLQKCFNVAFLVYLIVRRLPFEDAYIEKKACVLKVPSNIKKNLNGQIGVANLHQNKTLPKEKRDQRKAQKYFHFNKRF